MAATGARATITDVAREAGVSRATVSRVMNGRDTVDPVLAERVQQAASQLDYRPSSIARSLSLGRTQTVAVLIPELDNPMFQRVLQGFTDACGTQGYRVLVANTGDDAEREMATAVEARHRCDALLMVAPRASDEALVELLPQLQPAVVLGRQPSSEIDVPSLAIDYAAGVEDAVDHLVGLGHRRLLYVAGPAVSSSNRHRLEGLERARGRHTGLTIDTLPGGAHLEDGHGVARRVADHGATGVVVYNDLMAFGLLAGLAELGVRVPDELSVVGFDDIALAQYAHPALTTMAVPHVELGQRAWTRLAGLLSRDDEPRAKPYRPSLVVRNSTAAPRA